MRSTVSTLDEERCSEPNTSSTVGLDDNKRIIGSFTLFGTSLGAALGTLLAVPDGILLGVVLGTVLGTIFGLEDGASLGPRRGN